MAKKKVKTNFGEIENLHKNEVLQTPEGTFFINKGIVGKTHQAKEMEDYFNNKKEAANSIPTDFCFPNDLDSNLLNPDNQITDSDWQGIEDLRKEERDEAQWIKEMRAYCLENKVYPPHILQFYKEHHEHR